MNRFPHSSVVAAALIIGWLIFMIYHGDLPGFLWILGIGGAQPGFCAGASGGAVSTGSTGGGVSVTINPPDRFPSSTGPL